MTAPGLSPREQQLVHQHLDAPGAELFWGQDAADQRHAFAVASRVAASLPDDDEVYLAALLHDVGKRHARLGAIGRSIATVFDGIGIPLTAAMSRYRDHGSIGAAELSAAGFDGLVVSFAANHPGPPPEGSDDDRWTALLEADG
ncbi:MAG: hypothetical protein BMS9Abin07_0187 [Acidimicrobiia bacterium]|nr:MAG: hypothetical protein BMS9Abin07_0187 [Acidimicrobiia bacterium]